MVFIISAIQVPKCHNLSAFRVWNLVDLNTTRAEGKQVRPINRNPIIISLCIVCILFVFYFANGYLNKYVKIKKSFCFSFPVINRIGAVYTNHG